MRVHARELKPNHVPHRVFQAKVVFQKFRQNRFQQSLVLVEPRELEHQPAVVIGEYQNRTIHPGFELVHVPLSPAQAGVVVL